MKNRILRNALVCIIAVLSIQGAINLSFSAENKLDIVIKKTDYYKKYKLCDKEFTATAGNIVVVVILGNKTFSTDDLTKVNLSKYVFKYTSKKKRQDSIPAFAVGQQFVLVSNGLLQLWINGETGLIQGVVDTSQSIGGPAIVGFLPDDITSFQLYIEGHKIAILKGMAVDEGLKSETNQANKLDAQSTTTPSEITPDSFKKVTINVVNSLVNGLPQANQPIYLAYYDPVKNDWVHLNSITDNSGLCIFKVPSGNDGESYTFLYNTNQEALFNSITDLNSGHQLGYRVPPKSAADNVAVIYDGNQTKIVKGPIQLWDAVPARTEGGNNLKKTSAINENSLATNKSASIETLNITEAITRKYINASVISSETSKYLQIVLNKIVNRPFVLSIYDTSSIIVDNPRSFGILATGKTRLVPVSRADINFSNIQSSFIFLKQSDSSQQLQEIIDKQGVLSSHYLKIYTPIDTLVNVSSDSTIQEKIIGNKKGFVLITRVFCNKGLKKRFVGMDSANLGEIFANITANWADQRLNISNKQDSYVVEYSQKYSKHLRSASSGTVIVDTGLIFEDINSGKAANLLSIMAEDTIQKVTEPQTVSSSVYQPTPKTGLAQSNYVVPANNVSNKTTAEDGNWPHRGTFAVEAAMQIAGDLAGLDKIITAEELYMQSLNLSITDSNGVQHPINNSYSYTSKGTVFGVKLLYFVSNSAGIGIHLNVLTCAQELKSPSLNTTVSGELVSVINFGPNGSFLLYGTKYFGITLKWDLGFLAGEASSCPALDSLRLKGLTATTLSSIIQSHHQTTNLSGFQGNCAFTANLFLNKFISIDAGLSFYWLSAKLGKKIWPNADDSFGTFTPALYIGTSFYGMNK